ncbi:MAG: RHS repeat-associated core domain-containing protein, partial [Pseudobdellovibrio sp.]
MKVSFNYEIAASTLDSGDPNIPVYFINEEGAIDTKVSEFSNSIVIYHPDSWGLNGWTINVHHYFEKNTRVLFTGTGNKVPYENQKTINFEPYGSVIAIPDKENEDQYFLFDQKGRHLETRSHFLKKAVLKFHYDSDFKLTGIEDKFGKLTEIIYQANKLSRIKAAQRQETIFEVQNNRLVKATNSMLDSFDITYDPKGLINTFKSISGVITTFTYSDDGDFISESKNIGLSQTLSTSWIEGLKKLSMLANSGAFAVSEILTISTNKEITTRKNNSDEIVLTEEHLKLPTPGYSRKTLIESSTNQTTIENHPHKFWGADAQLTTSIRKQAASDLNTNLDESINVSNFLTFTDPNNPDSISLQKNIIYTDRGNTIVLKNYTNRTETINTADGKTTEIIYNENGQPVTINASAKPSVSLSYNDFGQLIKMQSRDSIKNYAYDQNGNLESVSNSLNQTTQFIRNKQGNILTQILPNGDLIKFEYSNSGELKKITTPNNQIHQFSLGLGDYLEQALTPSSKKSFYVYDADKRLKSVEKPSGKEITYNYNQDGEIENIVTPSGSYRFTSYDPQGRILNMQSADSIQTEVSWVAGQIESQKWYDTDGTLLANLSIKYRSSSINNIEKIYLNGSEISDYSYRYDGKIQSINNFNYFYSSHDSPIYEEGIQIIKYPFLVNYLQSTEPASLQTAQSVQSILKNTTLSNYKIERKFNSFGRAIESSIFKNQLDGTNSTSKQIADYDRNDRLTKIQRYKRNFYNGQELEKTDFYNNYSYPNGSNNNMKEFTQTITESGTPQKRTIASHDNEDKLLTLRGSINRDYTYTDDGDIKTMTNCYGTTSYDYDVIGNLKKVTLADGKVIEYKVDASNRRIKKLVNGVTKEYYLWYDQIHIAAILDENKAPKLTYIYGPESNSPSYVVKNNITYKILHDPGLGSIRYIVNPATQQIVQDIEYDEYGNIMKNTEPDFQPLTYAGGLYDSDTKLIRFGARDYDPTIGRWTTKDPI